MPRRAGFNALVLTTIVGAIGGVVYALNRHSSNEDLATGAPQQTVIALWAVMDLLVVLIGVGVAMVLTMAWRDLAPIEEPPRPLQ